MNARTLTTTTLSFVLAGVLPATAAPADPQLLSMVMPDAKVLAGVNVEQAKNSLFGQYVLTTMQPENKELQELTALTGFDPRRDVRELLVATSGSAESRTALVLARGAFDPIRIAETATSKGGKTQTYKGITIITDPKEEGGVAFVDVTLAVAGDLKSIQGAIDRLNTPIPLPSALAVKVNQWSGSQDAWVISAVPPASLKPPQAAPQLPGLTNQDLFNKIQQSAGGVKLGANVTVTAEADMTTAQDASSLSDVVKFLVNFASMQASAQNPEIAALARSIAITTNGAVLNLSFSLPENQLQQIVKPTMKTPQKAVTRERRM